MKNLKKNKIKNVLNKTFSKYLDQTEEIDELGDPWVPEDGDFSGETTDKEDDDENQSSDSIDF